MLALKTWLVATITADATLQGYLSDGSSHYNVYPMEVDVTPEQLPAITYADIGVTVTSVPKGMHIGSIQLDIWSKISALEVEQIYDPLQAVLNFQHSQTASISISGTLWWLRENGARDLHTPSRRIWRSRSISSSGHRKRTAPRPLTKLTYNDSRHNHYEQ